LRPRGEALPFGVFGGIAFVGFLASFGIRAANLEEEGASEESDFDEGEDTESGSGSVTDEEGRRLLR
jgi:hypothetical protein